MAGRLNVNKVTSALAETNPETQAYIDNLLIDNDFEAIQGMMWRGAIRDGDSYVMVDPNTAKWIVEPGYDGFSGMFALMDQGKDYPVWACKLFSYADLDLSGDEPTTTVSMKVIVYQPDKISYFTGEAGGQTVTIDTTANIEGIVDGVKQWPAKIVPIIHYADLKDSFTQFGESEIRKAIPVQDVLNRTLHSMVMASEFSAFKITW
jgi:hypothetical protein